jgi:L-fuculose-phosphate aldolase
MALPRWATALIKAARSIADAAHGSEWRTERRLRADLVRFGKMLHSQGMVGGTDGNLSVRLDSRRIMITPTGVSKGSLESKGMVIVNMDGEKLSGARNASTELGMHLTIYALRPDVRAVVHAHPCTATAFASAGIPLDEALCSEIVMTLGIVPLARYATPGSLDTSRALEPYIRDHDAILMANHGAVTYGNSLLQAYLNMESVEHFAKIMLATKQIGRREPLSPTQVRELQEARNRYRSKAESA